MSETQPVEFTKNQRDLLLRGLRYVRSSALLNIKDPSPTVEESRANDLLEIESLVEQLNGLRLVGTPANV